MATRSMRKYDEEFKINAAKLYLEGGRSYPQLSRELGVPAGTLAGWVSAYKQAGGQAFPGKGHIKPADAELASLRKELAIVREERDILKKALGIFSLPRR